MKIVRRGRWLLGLAIAILVSVLAFSVVPVQAHDGPHRICEADVDGTILVIKTLEGQTPHCADLTTELHDRSGQVENWEDPEGPESAKYCHGFTKHHDLVTNICDLIAEYTLIQWDLLEESHSAEVIKPTQKWFGGESIGPHGNEGCTGSFLVEKEGQKFITTAGHCIVGPVLNSPFGTNWFDPNTGWENTVKPIGARHVFWHHKVETFSELNLEEYAGDEFYDLGLIEVVDPVNLRPESAVFERTLIFDDDGNVVDQDWGAKVEITSYGEPEVGMEACVSSFTVGTRCGEITAVTSSNFQIDICPSAGGESGGPVYTRDGKALGVVSGHGCPTGMGVVAGKMSGLQGLGYEIDGSVE